MTKVVRLYVKNIPNSRQFNFLLPSFLILLLSLIKYRPFCPSPSLSLPVLRAKLLIVI